VASLAHEQRPRDLAGRARTRIADLSDVWAAATAAVVSLALGAYQLSQPSLWVDEAATYRAVTGPIGRLASEHHWLYYLALKPWTAVAGTTEFALRFPSVVAAAGACALLVPLGNRLLGAPVGSIAGVVLALNPFVVQWSQQARSYTIVLLLTIVQTTAFLALRERRSRRSWALYTICLGLFVLVQPVCAGLVAAAHFLAAPGFRARVLAAGLASMLATSVFLAGVYLRDSAGGTLVWNDAPTIGSVSHTILELSGALGVGLAVALLGLAVVRRERLLLACWAFAPIAILVAVTPIGHVFVDRYLIVSVPAFALLIAVALTRLRGWRLASAAGAFAAATVVGLVIWYSPDGSQNWPGEDWKAATRFAMQHGGAMPSSPSVAPAYLYYGGVPRKTGLYVIWSTSQSTFAGDWPVDVSFGDHLRVQRRAPEAPRTARPSAVGVSAK
jgi:mannosyltransferase